MAINKILKNIQNHINIAKYEKRQNEMNKFVNINNNITNHTAFNTLDEAKSTIANFAKHNGVSVDIYDGRKMVEGDEYASEALTNNLSDKLFVKVTNLISGKSKERIISSNTDELYPVQKSNLRLLQLKNSDKEYLSHGTLSTEDNFLRYVYRNIDTLTRQVTGKK
ncbi:MAG: hypothetical protein KH301_03880 [Brachyspira sp.]|nr:hypothetical protein [Brachyspira sp.]